MQEFSKNKNLNILLPEIKQAAGLLWNKGWAEANAGNFSVNVTSLCKEDKFSFSEKKIKTESSYKYLINNFLLISRSGSRMRDIAENPLPDICIIYIDKPGNQYYNIKLDLKDDRIPSSEILTHLEIQNQLAKENSDERIVLHTHPAELIALTQLKNFANEKNLNNLFFSVQPEAAIQFPEGIGFVPYHKAGSEKLAVKTKKKFRKHKIVLWEKHGCVSAGKDFNEAIDRTEIFVKSAKIFFMSRSAGNKSGGLNVHQIKELKKLNGK